MTKRKRKRRNEEERRGEREIERGYSKHRQIVIDTGCSLYS
jgi:hypothetical protein